MKLFAHHHHHCDDPWEQAPPWALELYEMLGLIIQYQENAMATLDEILADVTDESTQIDGLSTLIDGLKQQLADALAGANLPPAVQTKVDAIFTKAEANKGKIAAALAANAPPFDPSANG